MEDSFVSFENLNSINHSSAWIPRVFSHLRRKSESIPTDIDSSGLHMLTSFAPWGSTPSDLCVESKTLKARSDICRKKSNSADPIIYDKSGNDEIPETFLIRSSSQKSVHSRSVSLPTTFRDYLPDFLNNFMTAHPDEMGNNSNRLLFKLGDSHSIYFEGTGLGMYTVFIIEMELIKLDSTVETFKIRKRFSEFKDLHDNLINIYGVKLPLFPHKSVLGRFSSLVIQSRMTKFLKLLEFILGNPILKDSTLFLHFLGFNQEDSLEDFRSDCSNETYTTAMQL